MRTKGRPLAGRVRSKRSAGSTTKASNPFELKFNRAKHKMLGKSEKTDASGRPGASRKRAFEKRAGSLAFEWHQFGKANKIVDRRLGERDLKMTDEERVSRRFTAERQQQLSSKELPNEEDNDVQLTHKGVALTSIQKYERVVSDDEEEDGGAIDADVVSIAHFGGGVIDSADTDISADKATKRKDVIAELIAKSKQERYDKKMARDEQEDATERLDERWKELLVSGAMGSLARDTTQPTAKAAGDDYDVLFHELQVSNSRRGEAKERLKTEEELAEEERQRLIELEAARISRMDGPSQTSVRGDEADYDGGGGDSLSGGGSSKCFEVKYGPDGKLLDAKKVKRARIRIVRIDNESSDYDMSMSETVDDSEGDEDFDDLDEMLSDDEVPKSHADAQCTSGTAADASNIAVPADQASTMKEVERLPFVFEMPQSYEQLKALLSGESASRHESTVVTRLIKCYHPSLREGNKKRLARLFLLLLRYFDELSRQGAHHITQLGQIVSGLFALLKFNPEYGVRCVRALLRQLRAEHQRNTHAVPSFRAVALLTLVAGLFPVSDRFHPVCTPTVAFATHVLATARVCSPGDAARLVLLLTALSAYVEESKRYLPEGIAFLRGLFLTAVENEDDERSPTATFPVSLPHRRMLFVTTDCSKISSPMTVDGRAVFAAEETCFAETDENRLSVLRAAIAVTCKFVLIYSVYSHSFGAIFSPISVLLQRLPRARFPELLLNELESLEASINAECAKSAAQRQLQRPMLEKKMLTMLEPRIEENFDAERPRLEKGAAAKSRKSEKKRLTTQYKKEMRGAVRELRKDNQFLSREKRMQAAEKDKARKVKTKMIVTSLQGQESDYKKNLFLKRKR